MTDALDVRDGRRARRESVRAALSEALLGLVEETPFKDISVDDLTRVAGIKRSAFYVHFSDKQDLLVAAAAETAEALYAEADRWWHGEGRPERRLKDGLRGMTRLYERHAGLLRAATEVSTYDEDVRGFWREIVERFIVATEAHLRAEQAAGRVPDGLDARATAESLVWMAERCCYIYLARGERTPRELVDSLGATWTAVLYPDDGRPRRRGQPR